MLTATLLYSALLLQGLPEKDAQTMVCIAKAESNLDPIKINHKNRNHTKDYGLFQVNSIWLPICSFIIGSPFKRKILEQNNNIKCAMYIYHKQGLRAWATYPTCRRFNNVKTIIIN